MTSSFFRTGEVHALVVAKRLAVMDIEEVARHRALRAQQAGAHEVSQARKAESMAAITFDIGAVSTKKLINGCFPLGSKERSGISHSGVWGSLGMQVEVVRIEPGIGLDGSDIG